MVDRGLHAIWNTCPCSDKDVLLESKKGGWVPPLLDAEWIDPSRWGQVSPQVPQTSPIPKIMQGSLIPGGHPEWIEHHSIRVFGYPSPGHLQWLQSSPYQKGRPPTISGLLKSTVSAVPLSGRSSLGGNNMVT